MEELQYFLLMIIIIIIIIVNQEINTFLQHIRCKRWGWGRQQWVKHSCLSVWKNFQKFLSKLFFFLPLFLVPKISLQVSCNMNQSPVLYRQSWISWSSEWKSSVKNNTHSFTFTTSTCYCVVLIKFNLSTLFGHFNSSFLSFIPYLHFWPFFFFCFLLVAFCFE